MELANESLVETLGIITLCLFILAGIIAFLHVKKINILPFKIHPWIAVLAVIVAIVHALLVITQS